MSKVVYVDENTFNDEHLLKSKKLLVNFWAEWCGPCKIVNKILEELALEEDCDILLINVDKNPEMMHRFEIETIPNILFYSQGKLIEKLKKLDILVMKEEIRKKILL